MFARGHDRHAVIRLQWLDPVHATRLWIQTVERFGTPDDQLSFSSGLNDGWWTIARFLCRQSFPEFAAGILVERNSNTARSPDEANQLLTVYERRTTKAPEWSFRLVLLLQFLGPDERSLGSIQADKSPFCTQRVHLSIRNGRGHAWSRGIRNLVGHFIAVFPDLLPICSVQA